MQAVILAGGLATRLGERARQVPKVLLPIAGRPFLAWQLEALIACGFREVVLCIGHLGDQVRAFLGDGAAFGVAVAYSQDGPTLLDTGGALRSAFDLLEPTFLVTYGDSYLPFDYAAPLRDLEAHPEALGTMSVYQNDSAWDRSNTSVDGDLVLHYEKNSSDPRMRHIDYGAIALRREVLATREPNQAFPLDAILRELTHTEQLRAFLASERFYEIGSESGIRDLEALLQA